MYGQRKVKYDTLRKYICHLNDHAKFSGKSLVIPPLALQVAKQWRKKERNSSYFITPKPALQFEALQALCSLKAETPNHNVLLALTIFGYYSLARLGELIPEPGQRPPKFVDLVVEGGVATIFLQRSKTDYNRCGAPLSVPLDIWRSIEKLLGFKSLAEGKFNLPIFQTAGKTLTKASYNKWLVRSLVRAGFAPLAGTIGHSLRRGGAQYLWRLGHTIEEIRVRGRWVSDSWRRYINLNMPRWTDPPSLRLSFLASF